MDGQRYENCLEDDPTDFFIANSTDNDDSMINQTSQNDFSQISSDPYISITSSSHQAGRNKNAFTLVLEKFKAKNGKQPKREYVNASIIRAIKRAFRYITSGKIPKTTSIKIKITDERQMIYWNELEKIFRENISYITKLAKTNTGPQSDIKKKGKASKKPKITGDASKEPEIIEEASKKPEIMENASREPNCGARSFNHKFCQEFFSKEPARQAFFCLIEIFYSTGCPTELCQRFNFSCCDNMNNHKDDCMSKWAELKNYFNIKYFEGLDVNTVRNVSRVDEIQAYGSMMEIEELQEYPD